jgi:hypothetical protein
MCVLTKLSAALICCTESNYKRGLHTADVTVLTGDQLLFYFVFGLATCVHSEPNESSKLSSQMFYSAELCCGAEL